MVHQTAESLVFLDRRPLFPGHCLVVPRVHVETLDELPDSLLSPLFSEVRLISRVVQEALDAAGSFVAMNNRVSQSVPHLHVHVVPHLPRLFLALVRMPRPEEAAQTVSWVSRDRLSQRIQEILGED